MTKEPTEYKEGDIVKVEGFESPGIILGHEGDWYHIELSSPFPLKIIDQGNMVFYLEPKTYIKRMDVPVVLISPINEQEEKSV